MEKTFMVYRPMTSEPETVKSSGTQPAMELDAPYTASCWLWEDSRR